MTPCVAKQEVWYNALYSNTNEAQNQYPGSSYGGVSDITADGFTLTPSLTTFACTYECKRRQVCSLCFRCWRHYHHDCCWRSEKALFTIKVRLGHRALPPLKRLILPLLAHLMEMQPIALLLQLLMLQMQTSCSRRHSQGVTKLRVYMDHATSYRVGN